jgi:hypothetical protein
MNIRRYLIAILLAGGLTMGCANPFAPGLDTSTESSQSILGDQRTIEGVFRNFQYAYTFKDSTIYGQLLDPNFAFVYRDYDKGIDVSWGRDEDMRTTYGLFMNAQNLDLIWNNTVSFSGDSLTADITRSFSMTVTFNANDIIRVNGYANFIVARPNQQNIWKIVAWRDESNF